MSNSKKSCTFAESFKEMILQTHNIALWTPQQMEWQRVGECAV